MVVNDRTNRSERFGAETIAFFGIRVWEAAFFFMRWESFIEKPKILVDLWTLLNKHHDPLQKNIVWVFLSQKSVCNIDYFFSILEEPVFCSLWPKGSSLQSRTVLVLHCRFLVNVTYCFPPFLEATCCIKPDKRSGPNIIMLYWQPCMSWKQ